MPTEGPLRKKMEKFAWLSSHTLLCTAHRFGHPPNSGWHQITQQNEKGHPPSSCKDTHIHSYLMKKSPPQGLRSTTEKCLTLYACGLSLSRCYFFFIKAIFRNQGVLPRNLTRFL